MNRIYKVIWSKVKHQYIVVSELAHSCTKSTSQQAGRSAAAVLAVLALTTGVGVVPAGAATNSEWTAETDAKGNYTAHLDKENTVGTSSENNFIVGDGNSVTNSNNHIFGNKNALGTMAKDNYIIGDGNAVKKLEDAWVLGNNNQLYTESTGSWVSYHSIVIGSSNTIARKFDNSIILGNNNSLSGSATDALIFGSDMQLGATKDESILIGNGIQAGVSGNPITGSVIIGDEAKNESPYSVVLGAHATMGKDAQSSGRGVVIGSYAEIGDSTSNSIAIGSGAQDEHTRVGVDSDHSIAMGYNAQVSDGVDHAVAIGGVGAYIGTGAQRSTLVGSHARIEENAEYATALGYGAEVTAEAGTSIGTMAAAGSDHSIAIGGGWTVADRNERTEVETGATEAIALGHQARVHEDAKYSIAAGAQASVAEDAWNSVAIGYGAKVSANTNGGQTQNALAVGAQAEVMGNQASAFGYDSEALAQYATAVGGSAKAKSYASTAIGPNASVDENSRYSAAIGYNSTVIGDDIFSADDLVAFKDKLGDEYNARYNITSADGSNSGVLSVGKSGSERRIINVARGRISADSTDAVNGSQLHGLASELNEKIENAGGDWVLTTNGGLSEGETTTVGKGGVVDFAGAKDEANGDHQNIHVIQSQVTDAEGNVTGTNVSLALDDTLILGDAPKEGAANTQIILDSTTGKASFGDIVINGESGGEHANTITGLTNVTWNQEGIYNAGRAATEEQLQSAISEVNENAYKGWNLKVGDKSTLVDSDDTVVFQTDKNDKDASNLYITKDGLDVTIGMEDEITLTGVTADRVSVGDVVINKDTGINAGGLNINGVKDGEISKDSLQAVNGSQLWQMQQDVKTQHTTMTVNGGTSAVEGDYSTGGNLQLKQTTSENGQIEYDVKLNDKVVLGDAASDQIVLDGTTGLATIGDAISLNGTKGQASFGAVKINGEDGSTITGLTNKTWDQNGVYTDGRAATEEQLQDAIGDAASSITSSIHWNAATTEGEITSAKIGNANTVTFTGTAVTDDTTGETHQNIHVTQTPSENGTEISFALDDKLVLGTAISLDGTNGQASFEAVKINGETGGEHANTITGLTNTTWDQDGSYTAGRAATEEQLKDAISEVNASAYKSWNVSAGGNKGVAVDSGDTVDFSGVTDEEGNQNIVVTQEGTNLKFDLSDKVAIGNGDMQIFLNGQTGTMNIGGITIQGGGDTHVIQGLTNTTWDPDNYVFGQAATEDQLHQAISKVESNFQQNDQHLAANPEAENGHYTVENNQVDLKVQNGVDENGNPKYDTVTIDNVAQASDVGNVGDLNEGVLNKDGSHTTVVDAINNIDDRVTNIEGDIVDLGDRIEGVEATAGKHNSVSEGDGNVIVTKKPNPGEFGGADYVVGLNDDKITVGNETNNVTIEGTKGSITVTNSVSAGQTTISNEGVSVGGNTYITDKGINANNQVITNVAAGKEDTDAVNFGQLKDVQQQVTNNSTAITNIGNKVGELDSRIDEVGAGAAALAALHPLDFDPDDKWDFAAGYGNYRGENAVAIGAFYRPNEDTMFSVGGTVGNGDNMVNAGVSFKLGQGNGVSTSRVAMAKEIKDLRKELEAMKSAMLDVNAGRRLDTSKLQLFPDVPQNHWAYEYVATLAGNGVLEGYPDGNFDGARPMTRYEFAAMLYRAMLNGAKLSDKILTEFAPELERFTVDVVHTDSDGNPTVERVRVVKK